MKRPALQGVLAGNALCWLFFFVGIAASEGLGWKAVLVPTVQCIVWLPYSRYLCRTNL